MTSRSVAPTGSPCWADLFTSDVETSRRFYGELFGWEAGEAQAEFGGYFLFTREGIPVAGAMGDMGDVKATDAWKVYLATDDIARVVEATEAGGGQVVYPAMQVGDLGTQALLVDPTGAHLGAWQPATFHGFSVLAEPGAPSWFELLTRDHAAAVAFYQSVFGWETRVIGDSDEFRYTTMRNPAGEGDLAGIMDASAFLAEGEPSQWSVYWEVAEVPAALCRVEALGGAVIADVHDTPWGPLATVADPAGAQLKLHTTKASGAR